MLDKTRPTIERYDAALAVVEGACNPSGICYAIIGACSEIRSQPDYSGTDQIRSDPAIRLMVYQLAYLCNTAEFDQSLTAYGEAVDVCKAAVEGRA
jgi:hypothetical protein